MIKSSLTTLTRTQLQQLKSYCDWAATSGNYYGNQAQFIARHNAIVAWLQNRIDTTP